MPSSDLASAAPAFVQMAHRIVCTTRTGSGTARGSAAGSLTSPGRGPDLAVSGIRAAPIGNAVRMSDHGDTPTELREEVEQELDELAEDAAEQERDRISEREAQGVDEPNDEVNQSGQ